MAGHSIASYLTAGGAVGTFVAAFRAIYLLGSILESFRQHVRQSDATNSQHDERLRYLERKTQ